MSEKEDVPGWIKALLAALATLTAAVIGILTSFDAVHWSAAQIALVVAESAAFWAFASALVANSLAKTQKQPVALAGTVTALVTATVAVGIGFSWWQASEVQNAYITSLVTASIAVGSALVARTRVNPIDPIDPVVPVVPAAPAAPADRTSA